MSEVETGNVGTILLKTLDRMGHDHLHVVYVPVVQKEIKWTKRAGPELAGRVEKLDEKITVREKAKATIAEVDAMGHTLPLVPGVHYSDDEAKRLKTLAKKSVTAQEDFDKRTADYRKKIDALGNEIRGLQGQVNDLNRSVRTIAAERDSWKENYNRLWAEVKSFIDAIRKYPQQFLAFVREHLHTKNQNREVAR